MSEAHSVTGHPKTARAISEDQVQNELNLRQILPYISPYLSLSDIHSLTTLNRSTADIIHSQILSGQVVTIDNDTLQRLPTATNSEFYTKYGAITSDLKLKGIKESELSQLLQFFKNVRRLTLVDVVIISESCGEPPSTLTAFSLISCQIERNILDSWFHSVKGLELLYMDHLVYHKSTYEYQENLKLSCLSKLKTLSIKGDILHVDVRLDHLTSLTLVATDLGRSVFECPKLQSLVFDVVLAPTWHNYRVYDRLRSLTVKCLNLEMVSQCSKLEHLKVYRSVDPKHEQSIVTQYSALKNSDLHYYDVSPTPNLILDKLSNELLLTIANFLPIEDCLAFGSSHPRIDQLLAQSKNHSNELRVDGKALRAMLSLFVAPPYTRQLQYVTTLHVTKVADKDLLMGIQCFSRLKTLKLEKIQLSDETIASLPLGLTSLGLTNCQFDDKAMGKYLRRLNPTLRELEHRCLKPENNHLQQLNNICAFKFHLSRPYSNYIAFLRNNESHLERIEILFDYNETIDGLDSSASFLDIRLNFLAYSSVIKDMKNLTSLTIDLHERLDPGVFGYDRDNAIPRAHDFDHLVPMITELGPQLRELALRVRGHGFKGICNCLLLPKLESLRLISGARGMCEEDIRALSTITSIRKFSFEVPGNYREKEPMEIKEVIGLIKSWPHLVEMDIFELSFSLRTAEELRMYLRENNRQLTINSSEY